MKIGQKMLLGIILTMISAQMAQAAEEKFKDQKEKISYAWGLQFGNYLKKNNFDINIDTVTSAMKDVIAGSDVKMTEAEMRDAITQYQREMNAKRDEERKKTAEKNRKEGETWLAENKKKEGVKTHAVMLPDGAQELQYKVITDGTGAIPKSNDTVAINFRGTLTSGKEFDSSAKRGGQPFKTGLSRHGMDPFSANHGIAEAVQLMKVGSKWEIYLPSTLGFGDYPGPGIEPGSALIYEVELVGVDTPQPLTSDIIRVPSAEELKAGAKIEVIKPEDIEKIKAQEAEKAKALTNVPK